MLTATKSPRKPYKVKKGYVYSDGVSNHYREGDVVELTDRQFDLARHRLELQKPVVAVPQERPAETIAPKNLFKGKYEIK